MTKKQRRITLPNHYGLILVLLLLGCLIWAKQTAAADYFIPDSNGVSATVNDTLNMRNCSNTGTGLQPLMDLPRSGYEGFSGRLYPRGNEIPEGHLQMGLAASEAIEPLNKQGQPSNSGKIILLSLGMSNTSQEFEKFIRLARGQADENVVLMNGAQAGYDAVRVADPTSNYWTHIDGGLAGRGFSRLQVQVVWIKEAVSGETDPFPQDAQQLQSYLRGIVLIVKNRYPNVKAIYFSSRVYGGYSDPNSSSPEPWAYRGGFAVKWLIESQIDGTEPTLSYANTPWLAWGPYLWADGLNPRSDGLIWSCDDFEDDGLHPSALGELKVANRLLDFFRNDPTTQWFPNT